MENPSDSVAFFYPPPPMVYCLSPSTVHIYQSTVYGPRYTPGTRYNPFAF